MLSRPETRVQTALEVALVPDSGFCTDVENIVKARMAATCSLLCCLSVDGKLRLGDVSEAGAPVQISEDSYTEWVSCLLVPPLYTRLLVLSVRFSLSISVYLSVSSYFSKCCLAQGYCQSTVQCFL